MSQSRLRIAYFLLIFLSYFLLIIGTKEGGASSIVSSPPQAPALTPTEDDMAWIEYDQAPLQSSIATNRKSLLKQNVLGSIMVTPWKIVQVTTQQLQRVPVERLLLSAKYTTLLYVSYAGLNYFMASVWPQLLSWKEAIVMKRRDKIRRRMRNKKVDTTVIESENEEKKAQNALENVSKEQEEIWKVLHNMYDTQSEKISLVINATEANREFMGQLRANIELNLSKLSSRIDDVMVDLNVLNGKFERVAKEIKAIDRVDSTSSTTNTLELVQAEVSKCKNEVANLKKETLEIIRGHDDMMIGKLKAYLNEIKIVKKTNTKSSK